MMVVAHFTGPVQVEGRGHRSFAAEVVTGVSRRSWAHMPGGAGPTTATTEQSSGTHTRFLPRCVPFHTLLHPINACNTAKKRQ